MSAYSRFSALLLAFTALTNLAQVRETRPASSLADRVNVLIGTASEGQTFPATGVPFGMTHWTPQTRAGEIKCVAPYYAGDTRIQGFRGSHFLSGSCAQDYGSFTVMPLNDSSKLEAAERSSAFSRSSEQAHPYQYTVDLADSGIHAEITGSERSGMMRFRFAPGRKTGWLAVESNLRLGKGTMRIDPVRQEITGENPAYRIYAGADQPAGFSGYVVVQFDRPFRVGGTWAGGQRHDGALEQESTAGAPGAFVTFGLGADHTVRVRIGTSFTSVEEARRNLAGEMPDWDFDAAAARAHAAWEKALGQVEVGGDSPDLTVFYTAMYHSKLLPRIVSDRSGTYPRFAGKGQTELAKGFTYYDDFSVWDTYRAVHPLLTIVEPERDAEMIRSLIAKGEQGGFLPIFPAWNNYTAEMTGDHVAAIVTDAYVKGIRGFDAEEAYALMRKNAMEDPADLDLYKDGRGRRALASYLKYGYLPLEDRVPYAFHGDEQVSRTLDYAFDDYEVGVLAAALGHKEDAALFAGRSGNWRKVIDPAVGFARGRHADGSWVTPFDPKATASYITESTPYVDTFSVPQDVPGLIAVLHGPEAFIQKLDGLFASGTYDQGNEPSHHIAYLYDDAGAAAKTQLHVHDIMTRLYTNKVSGLIGNDDAGQMSAWYVMSALGFYPVTPGTPRYSIGTPHFDEMTVHVAGGERLHIVARGAEAGRFYVRSVTLNGRRLERMYLLHQEIVGGGELVFEMSEHPAQS
ncbi:alpha-1,2-mannosidase, putative [Granulicella pectinivorans]|uniref:Alpha-1,2-mannosidase, putative n=1 Tax=Granulicella pectinivorans TaxID=474950 RepID=A0A1I6MR65_9BACT|nr:GH92 family glycosyl hydrolase [Granulicella pectinivorans]SFS18243.1 alpha-1,2-mannosidase, putative [Granulicella pectinivorans]